MPYPTGSDLPAFLTSYGITPTVTLTNANALVAAAVREWESRTGWEPFLAVTETREFDAPVADDWWSEVGIISVSSISVDGNTVGPAAYDLRNRYRNGPYLSIRFNAPRLGTRKGMGKMSITGVFGYSSSLPADVTDAILSKAAFEGWPGMFALDGDIKRTKIGTAEIEYGSMASESGDTRSGRRGAFLRSFESAVSAYRRPVC
jgi:hypothetical protein